MPSSALLGYTSHLDLIGDETSALLERLVTCRVESLAVADSTRGALLTPQGKVLADFILERLENGFRLHLHRDAVADLEKRMRLYRLRAKIDIIPHESDPSEDTKDRVAAGLAAFGRDFGASEVFPTDINLDHHDGIDYRKGCFVGQEVASRMMRRGKIRKRTLIITGDTLQKGQSIKADTMPIGTVTSVVGRQGPGDDAA